jgi:hypothetical protein
MLSVKEGDVIDVDWVARWWSHRGGESMKGGMKG